MKKVTSSAVITFSPVFSSLAALTMDTGRESLKKR